MGIKSKRIICTFIFCRGPVQSTSDKCPKQQPTTAGPTADAHPPTEVLSDQRSPSQSPGHMADLGPAQIRGGGQEIYF